MGMKEGVGGSFRPFSFPLGPELRKMPPTIFPLLRFHFLLDLT